MKIQAIFLSEDPEILNKVWGKEQKARLREHVEIPEEIFSASQLAGMKDDLREVKAIFSSWGMPALSPEQLDLLPQLGAVFYAAGSVKYFAAPFLARGIVITSAWAANAIPVAEYTLSQILFGLKSGWQHVQAFRDHPGPESWKPLSIAGCFGSTVGIVSLGQIGRKVCELLQPFTLERLAHDPHVSEKAAQECGAELVSLEDLFQRSDVVSLHLPWLKATEGLITGKLIASMKPYATLINTARGAVIRENELVDVLRQRPDLVAILDVSHPEPPVKDSPLYSLPNVILTPHIAGSNGKEVQRMSNWMIDEFISWKSGAPLQYAMNEKMIEAMT